MFGWLDKLKAAPPAIPEVNGKTDLNELLSREQVILFKHSTACPVSWTAHSHIVKFIRHNPALSVYLVPVIQQRASSRAIAERTGMRHESPQVILICKGVAIDSASHGEITESFLSEMLTQCR